MKTIWLNSVTEITPELLEKNGITALILDLDNTLTTHDNPVPGEGVLEWIEGMKSADIQMIIVSNNHAERVKPFAKILGLDFVPDGKKPLSKGINEAGRRLGAPFSETAIVGDQIFTDILAAKLKRLRSIYVKPIEHETTTFFKFKRKMERFFIPKEFRDN